jgi:hypothetical protein
MNILPVNLLESQFLEYLNVLETAKYVSGIKTKEYSQSLKLLLKYRLNGSTITRITSE